MLKPRTSLANGISQEMTSEGPPSIPRAKANKLKKRSATKPEQSATKDDASERPRKKQKHATANEDEDAAVTLLNPANHSLSADRNASSRSQPVSSSLQAARQKLLGNFQTPLRQARQDALALGITLRTGHFSPEEDDAIRNSVNVACERYGIQRSDVLKILMEPGRTGPRPEKDRLIMAKITALWLVDLPDRMTKRVLGRSRILFNEGLKSGPYTLEEDAEIRRLYNLWGPKWTKIGKLLHRERMALSTHFRSTLQTLPNVKGPWKIKEAAAFRSAVEKQSGEVELWASVAAVVKTRSASDCREFWKTHPLERGPLSWSKEETVALLNSIKKAKPNSEADIAFDSLAEYSDLELAHCSAEVLRSRWIDLRQYHIYKHGQPKTFKRMVKQMLKDVEEVVPTATSKSTKDIQGKGSTREEPDTDNDC